MSTRLVLPAAADMHLHLRQGIMARQVAPFTAAQCHRVLVMPNTTPAIETAAQANAYRDELAPLLPGVDILTAIKFTPNTNPSTVRVAANNGVAAVKLYPDGTTTNSHGGIPGSWLDDPPQQFLDSIDVIRRTGMVLCMHGEMPGRETRDREQAFLGFVDFLAMNFPSLRMVLEHISTKEAVEKVRTLAERSRCHVAATITAHHLHLTMDDVIGDKLAPHNFCKPIAKWADDRAALVAAATGGEPCFFLGSDSAPHDPAAKECSAGCAGCFTAPVLVESLIEVFEKRDCLSALPNFMRSFGSDFYCRQDEDIPVRAYKPGAWRVPERAGGVRPWRAGETLHWQLDG